MTSKNYTKPNALVRWLHRLIYNFITSHTNPADNSKYHLNTGLEPCGLKWAWISTGWDGSHLYYEIAHEYNHSILIIKAFFFFIQLHYLKRYDIFHVKDVDTLEREKRIALLKRLIERKIQEQSPGVQIYLLTKDGLRELPEDTNPDGVNNQ